MSKNEGESEEDIIEELDELPKEGEEGFDKINWQERAEKAEGIAKRRATKIDKLKKAAEAEPKPKPPVKKEGEGNAETKDDRGFDRIDRSNLRTEKITEEDELDLVAEIMKETGKDVEGVLKSRYFQTELKSMRDEKEANAGIPKSTKRVNNSSRNEVDYWIAKGELPPMTEPALRQKVVNAKIAKERAKTGFSQNPVIL